MLRTKKVVVSEVTWTDDIAVRWAGPTGPCLVKAALDYTNADARLVLRRGPNEMILASGLGQKMSHIEKYVLEDGDEVVLQWRALTPSEAAESEVAELTIEGVQDQFSSD
jgi:hypothetical protein